MNKRVYTDGCAVSQALDIIGERWALHVIRELMFGPKRFTDLRASLPGISANVLTQRLDDLEAASILVRTKTPPPNAVAVYALTDWGKEAEILFTTIGRWAARSPLLVPGPMSVNSVILSFRTMFNAEAAGKWRARIGLLLAGEEFVANIEDGALSIDRGATKNCDAIIEGAPDDLAAIVYMGEDMANALAEGRLKVTGDRKAAARFVRLFILPERAPVTCGNAS